MRNLIKKILKEELDWVKDESSIVTTEGLRSLMSNCEDIKVLHYNIDVKYFYTRRGEPMINYYSMCPYWWDKLKDNEWFEDGFKKNKVAVIMPDWGKGGDVREMSTDDFSAITWDLQQLPNYFNANKGELWILMDGEGNPIYDFVPKNLVKDIKDKFEKFN
jgi:hypothetical protein